MKSRITIEDCYAKTAWYSGTLSVINDKDIHSSLKEDEVEDLLDESEEITFTVVEEWSDNSEIYVGPENITFQEDLPDWVDEEELRKQIIEKFNDQS